ncbi:MAG TPA: twin-arginine translocase TatA/TatE family subunit [Thermoleophilaceae bacterium]|nr:twin-arginine translocase TatA/TatE family subunit [Thermoleophilaceae bacterium]
MPLGIGPTEIIIVLIIVLVIFGPKRLPDLGRSLGRGMREFKDSVTGNDKDELPEGTHVSSTKVTSTTVTAEQPDPAPAAPESKP